MAKYRIVERGNGTYRVDRLWFGLIWLVDEYTLHKSHAYDYVDAKKIEAKPDTVLEIIDTGKPNG